MHPAKSVIFFTTASGAGYGLMVWLGVLAALGLIPEIPLFGLIGFGLAFALIVSGLLSSTLHLGRPERAWRALSQWRSSWLSREGVAAIFTFIPLGLFALHWVVVGENGPLVAALGLFGGMMSLVTIFTTSQIYASLKAIPAWHNGWTTLGYLVLGPMNGAVILLLLAELFAHDAAVPLLRAIALVMLLIGLVIKLAYWSYIRSAPAVSTAGTATGLGHLGRVEMTASPHDSDNYLMREMGFRIARKHADKLRTIALVLGFLVPIILIAVPILTGSGPLTLMLTAIAFLVCQTGIYAERWLFFAEAKHAVTLFYGAQAV